MQCNEKCNIDSVWTPKVRDPLHKTIFSICKLLFCKIRTLTLDFKPCAKDLKLFFSTISVHGNDGMNKVWLELGYTKM